MPITPKKMESRGRFVRRFLASSDHRTLSPRERVAKAHEAFESAKSGDSCKCGGSCKDCQKHAESKPISPLRNEATVKAESLTPSPARPGAPNHFRQFLAEYRKNGCIRTLDGKTIKGKKAACKYAYREAKRLRGVAREGIPLSGMSQKSLAHKGDGVEAVPVDAIEQAARETVGGKKGKVVIHGIPVRIENPRGSVRRGVDRNGKAWAVKLAHHYGEIARQEGADGDPVDCFIGPNPESETVFVIDQIDPHTKRYDEAKVMLGFRNELEARDGYLASYNVGWQGLGDITTLTLPEFREWLVRREGDKPISPRLRLTEPIELSVTKKSMAAPMSAIGQQNGGALVPPPRQGFASTHKHIVKIGPNKFRLYSRKKDPKTGQRKNLGTFSSRAAALKHERAVEYFKHASMSGATEKSATAKTESASTKQSNEEHQKGSKWRRVLEAYKRGTLKTKVGHPVTSMKQALAVAFSEQRHSEASHGRHVASKKKCDEGDMTTKAMDRKTAAGHARPISDRFHSGIHPMPVGSKVKARQAIYIPHSSGKGFSFEAGSQEDLEVVKHEPTGIRVRNSKGQEAVIARPKLRGKTTGKGHKLPANRGSEEPEHRHAGGTCKPGQRADLTGCTSAKSGSTVTRKSATVSPDTVRTCRSQPGHPCNACCTCQRCRSAECLVTYTVPATPRLTLKRAEADSTLDLPQRRGLVHRNKRNEIETDDDRMTASGILATSDRDRQGDIIECRGVEFEDHKLNPVSLWDHGKWGGFPIGITEDEDGVYTVKYLPDKDIIVQTTHFAQSYPIARQIYALVRDRIIRANSIAVKDIEVEPLPADPDQGHFQKRDADGRRIPFKHILRSALAEVTWTSLPANPDAVMSLLASNRIDDGGFNRVELDPLIRKSLLWHVPRRSVWTNGMVFEDGITRKSMTGTAKCAGSAPRWQAMLADHRTRKSQTHRCMTGENSGKPGPCPKGGQSESAPQKKPAAEDHGQLSGEDARIDRETQARAKEHYGELADEYLKKTATFGKDGKPTSIVLNTDEWRDLFPEYTGTNAAAVHEASSYLNKRLLADALKTMKGKGNNRFVVLAGGGGSGKGSAIGQYFDESRYPIRLDQVSDSLKKLEDKFAEAKAHGYEPEYIFIDRHPKEAWAGVVGRAQRGREKGGIARTVPLEVALKANLAARQTAIEVLKKHPDVLPKVIDNNHEPGKAVLLKDRDKAIAYLEKQQHDYEQLYAELKADTLARYEAGKLDEDIAEGLLGKETIRESKARQRRGGEKSLRRDLTHKAAHRQAPPRSRWREIVATRKSGLTRKSADTYFAKCERDEQGHCLPSGQGGQHGGEESASASPVGKPVDLHQFTEPAGLAEHAEKTIANLKPEQRSALELYANGGGDFQLRAQEINGKMRQCPPKFDCLSAEQRQQLDALESAIAKAGPLPEPTTVYRGLAVFTGVDQKIFAAAAEKAKTGELFTMPSLTSTTCAPAQAVIQYATPYDQDREDRDYYSPVLFSIKAKTGLYLESITKWKGEREILQSSKTQYRVVAVEDTDFLSEHYASHNGGKLKRKVIYLEEV